MTEPRTPSGQDEAAATTKDPALVEVDRDYLAERCPKCLARNGDHIVGLDIVEPRCPDIDELAAGGDDLHAVEERRMADVTAVSVKGLAALLERLDEAGTTGLDLVATCPLARDAAAAIRALLVVRPK